MNMNMNTMNMNTVAWMAGDKKIEILVTQDFDGVEVYAYVSGRLHATTHPVALKEPATVDGERIVATIGKIALTQERYDQVSGLISNLQTRIDNDPEIRMHKLIKKRKQLAEEISDLLDAAHEEYVDHIERVSACGYAKPPADYAEQLQAARDALAAFDAAHPEVRDRIAADKAAAAARFWEID